MMIIIIIIIIQHSFSRPTVGPTWPPIQWVSGCFLQGYMDLTVKLTTNSVQCRWSVAGLLSPKLQCHLSAVIPCFVVDQVALGRSISQYFLVSPPVSFHQCSINSSVIDSTLYCIVVRSRRLTSPDALQPKACCTNPGLQSFLLAPAGVFTRDPSSERRNYLGEKWPMNFA